MHPQLPLARHRLLLFCPRQLLTGLLVQLQVPPLQCGVPPVHNGEALHWPLWHMPVVHASPVLHAVPSWIQR